MKNETLKAFKFRIYPDKEQQDMLNQTFGCVRVLWNQLVQNFDSYGTESYKEKFSEKEIKQNPDLFFLSDVSAAALQQKRMDFNETKSQFFNKKRKVKIGRMKFKSKRNKQSYRLPNQKFSLNQENKTIRLEKIGHVPVVLDRTIPSDVDYRSATVSKTPTGKFYVSILVKINVDLFPATGRSVGIDLGLKDLFIMSNGDSVSNPRWFRESQAKLSISQKHLSRKKKSSNRYEKQRLKVAKIHEHVVSQRKHFLHNITSSLIKNFDVICLEDLNISGMKKTRLAKSVSDASWSEFIKQLEYKSGWYGRSIIKIDRWYPSSQLCSSCGHKDGKKPLSVRSWKCSNCGTLHDRDLNAANNILQKGWSDLTGQPIKLSAESVDYERGEDVSLVSVLEPNLAASVKRLDKSLDLS